MRYMAALQRHTMNSSTSPSANSVTQLEFHQAMSDFKIMFPSMEEEVIECVLRSNNGAVDATIDQLLQMASDLEKGLGQPHPPPPITSNGSPANNTTTTTAASKPMNQRNQLIAIDDEDNSTLSQTPPPTYHQAVPSDQAGISNPTSSRVKNCNIGPSLPVSGFTAAVTSNILSQKVSNNSLRARFKWNPPLVGPLPDTFLRFPDPTVNRFYQSSTVQRQGSRNVVVRQRSHSERLNNTRSNVLSTSLLQQKMQENELKRQSSVSDPEAAQYLDDERLAILMQNEEFVRELRNNKDFMSQLQRDAGRTGDDRDGGTASGGAGTSNFSDAAFREMLKNMSKVSRKKFAQVAGMFRKRNKGEESPGRHVSKDHLLASGKEDEYRELQNDSDDSEDRHSPYRERSTSDQDPYFVGVRSPDRHRRPADSSGFRL